jgi:glycerol-3-phosphate dehydrogenase
LAATARDNPPHIGNYDVIVIGAGIMGAMIARELSKLQGDFAVLEKEVFPSSGVSKASLAQIHLPDFCPPDSLKGRMCRNAPAQFKKLSEELDAPYREVGQLWLALEPGQVANLEEARKRGEANGAAGYEMIGPDKIRDLEPHVSDTAVAGLYCKGVGVIHPPEWVFALVENAIQNGVRFYPETAVVDITKRADGTCRILTSRGTYHAKYVINAAGLYADNIASMTGDGHIRLHLRRGTMLVFDKSASHLVRHMIFGTFGPDHSQDISPTVHGNLILGIRYVETNDKSDTSVSREDIRQTLALGQQLVPALSGKDIITEFSGIMADTNMTPNNDFYIASSENSHGVIHVMAGAPGLTAAPGIAAYVIDLLADAGMRQEPKKTFQAARAGWPRFATASPGEKTRLIAGNPKYGHILCRCEQVSEAEIQTAIRRGANTMDAVKHLTRAGMGRCQGGFCGIPVLNQLAGERGVSPAEITKS